ncbi:MAG: hypothetical protein AAFU78_23645, partial [Cyanobacteria bacterium J06633_2]
RLTIQRLLDADPSVKTAIWESPAGLDIHIARNPHITDKDSERFIAYVVSGEAKELVGCVSPESAEAHHQKTMLGDRPFLAIQSPHIELKPAYCVENDADTLRAHAQDFLATSIAQIPEEERVAYAAAAWHHSDSMDITLKAFTQEAIAQLQQPAPVMKVTGLQYDSNHAERAPDGDYTIQFTQLAYEKDGEQHLSPAIALVDEHGEAKTLGAIDPRSMRLPEGVTATATIRTPLSDKVQAQIGSQVIQIKKLSQHDFSDHPWQQEQVELKFERQGDGSAIATTMSNSKTIGIVSKIDTNALARTQSLNKTLTATLNRDHGTIAEVQVHDVIAVSLPEPDQSPATILDTDASHCLYRFVNNDSCERYTPREPAVIAVM